MKTVEQIKSITEIINVYCDECGKKLDIEEQDEACARKQTCFLCGKDLCQDCRGEGYVKNYSFFGQRIVEEDVSSCEDCTKIYVDKYMKQIQEAHGKVEHLFIELRNECTDNRWERDNSS